MLNYCIQSLLANRNAFEHLLSGLNQEEYSWREREGKWSIIEVVCHLRDEEIEDFRARVKSVLETPEKPFVQIDPANWVSERKYADQDYKRMLTAFLSERDKSIEWLSSLTDPKWDNAYNHPKVGPVSARFLLTNWLAHDYLHLRQVIRIKYNYLHFYSGHKLDYAGEW